MADKQDVDTPGVDGTGPQVDPVQDARDELARLVEDLQKVQAIRERVAYLQGFLADKPAS